jgi:hypothetical protein
MLVNCDLILYGAVIINIFEMNLEFYVSDICVFNCISNQIE